MKAIAAIALNTFREAVRNRILYIILIFALLLMASSGIVRDLTIAAHDRVVRDFGLTCINFFGLAVAILVGIGLVYNELDKKSIYTIVSKPIARWQFLLGKYFGLLLTIYVNILIMAVFFLAVLNYQDRMREEVLLEVLTRGDGANQGWVYTKHVAASVVGGAGKAVLNLFGLALIDQTRYINLIVLLTALELAIITAFAILYSSFSTPTLSAIFTVMTFIAGRLNEDIWAYAAKLAQEHSVATVAGAVKYWLAVAAYLVAPNLGAFEQGLQSLNRGGSLVVDWAFVIPYGFVYPAGVLLLAILIFRSRNFK